MKRWQIWQITTGLGALGALLLLNAIVSYQNILRLAQNKQQVSESREHIELLERTLSTIKDAETGQRGYLLTGRDVYLEPYDRAIAQIQQHLRQLDHMVQHDVAQQQQVRRLKPAITLKLAELQQTIQLRRTQGLASVLPLVQSDHGKQRMDHIRQVISEMQTREHQQLHQHQQEFQTRLNLTLATFSLVIGLCLSLLGLIVWMHHRHEHNRQAIEARLRHSEQQYESLVGAAPVGIFRTDANGPLVGAAPVGIFRTDANGHCVYVNDGWCQISGLTLKAALGDGWRQGLHPDDRERITAEWYQSVQENRPFQLEYRFQAADGKVSWVYGQSVAKHNEKGEITGYVGTITNISDRKAIELKLQEQTNLLELFIQYAPVNIIMCDREMRYLLVTQQMLNAYFPPGQDVLGRSHYEVLPHQPPYWREVHQRVLQGAIERCEEEPLTWEDGIVHWVRWEVRPWYTLTHEIGGLIIFSEDITQRKQMENELRQSEEQLRTVLQEMPVMLDAFDPNFNIIVWNQECERVTGFTAAEVMHNPTIMEHFYPDPAYRNQMIQAWAERGDNYRNWEWDITCKDGSTRTISWSNISDMFAVPGWASWGIGVDVTERRQAEASLRELNATLEHRVAERTVQLEEINQELQAFTYSVSHDLRAPLRIMQGFAQALQEDYGDRLDAMAHTYIRSITDSAIQMDALINDLLAYSRLTRTEVQIQPVELQSVVQTALQQLQTQIQASRAEIAIAANLPTVLAHRPTLVQVLINLISNGLKFVASNVQPRITIHVSIEENWARLSIVDNGIGIAPDHQQRIFRVFERLHGIDAYAGTGIGLAIVQKGMERMGGSVGVESQLGRGSCFWIRLPLLVLPQTDAMTDAMTEQI
ncbi:MAG: PAS domain S-box protein [Leptolyngbyaceae cyanobacterium bins.349]|nr:PAS domain S-box protein [Leptolyngbyaceae cyanobacterium bins.349]